jgi:ABC-2 type transport system permease protein
MAALRSYVLLMQWHALRMKMFLPLLAVVQTLFALGIVLGYPLLFPELDQTTILYLATGAPAISLITIGLVAVPQFVAQGKQEGTLEYMRSLPIARIVYLFADLSVWLVLVLPGVAFAVVVSAIRFNLDLHVSPLVVPVILLVALTSSAVGYAIATLLLPMVANVITQVLVVFVLMFSPLNFPPDRLPDWLAAVHRVLPIQAMGELIRGTVAGGPQFPIATGNLLLLAAWALAALAASWAVMSRRG